MTVLHPLVQRDGLRRLDGLSYPAFLHDDHRWALPLLLEAQNRTGPARPCTLVMFDAHHDCKTPRAVTQIRKLRDSGLDVAGVIDLCENHLGRQDDDWVIAGMELGLIDHAVVFGVEDQSSVRDLRVYTDDRGIEHRFWFPGLPGAELLYQGALSDLARSDELRPLWRALDWEPTKGFGVDARPIFLNIDLDAFVVRWRDYKFPWPDEVWEHEFLKESDYFSTAGWSGLRFFEALSKKAGLLAIAREPDYCGGQEKTSIIFESVNRYLFDSALLPRSLQ